ncbi:MAG: sugar kinase [Atopobiaceae bacterium]|nr:sugar kinase [Atopobiaceae bacterium]
MGEKSILLVGEPMGLFIAKSEGAFEDVDEYSVAIAGAEFNVAVGLTRLGHAASYLTKLGPDPFGKRIVKFMQRERISTDDILYDDTLRTGFMLKGSTSEGDPAIYYFRAGSAASTLSPADVAGLDFSKFSAIHMTGITPALSDNTRELCRFLAKKAHEEGIFLSFDPNLRPQLWLSQEVMASYINEFAAQCDLFLPGIAEGKILAGLSDPAAIAEHYRALGAGTVVVKVGGDGAYFDSGDEKGMVPGFHVSHIVDTVGAGDGFAAGVLSARMEGLSWYDSVRRGNAIGAIQIMSVGDNDGLPTREELAQFMLTDEH